MDYPWPTILAVYFIEYSGCVGVQNIDLVGPTPITAQLYFNPDGLKLAPIHPYLSLDHAKAPMGRVHLCAPGTWGATLLPLRGNMSPSVRSPEPTVLLLLRFWAVIVVSTHVIALPSIPSSQPPPISPIWRIEHFCPIRLPCGCMLVIYVTRTPPSSQNTPIHFLDERCWPQTR